jgi:F-type H+-transporting ATPase subunit a
MASGEQGHDTHEGGDHGHHGPVIGDSYLIPYSPPTINMWIEQLIKGKDYNSAQHPVSQIPLGHSGYGIPVNPIFSIVYAVVLILIIRKALKNATVRTPGKLQNFIELCLKGLYDFFGGIFGPGREKYIPFVGSLFLFIFINNIMGLIPFLKSPTAYKETTAALGICTFIYVQFCTIKDGGIVNWFMHLVGKPLWLAPLMFPLHVLGELIKPVSLSARLFGNILGEDKLLTAFLGLGMMITAYLFSTPTPVIGLPINFWVYFLMILGSTIQAVVFSLLASIYIVLLLPHDDHHDEEQGHGEAVVAAGH